MMLKLKDMTIEELRKYQEIPTAKPRNDIIRVKDLRKWAEANAEQLLTDGMKRFEGKEFHEVCKKETELQIMQRCMNDYVADWVIKKFKLFGNGNLEDG